MIFLLNLALFGLSPAFLEEVATAFVTIKTQAWFGRVTEAHIPEEGPQSGRSWLGSSLATIPSTIGLTQTSNNAYVVRPAAMCWDVVGFVYEGVAYKVIETLHILILILGLDMQNIGITDAKTWRIAVAHLIHSLVRLARRIGDSDSMYGRVVWIGNQCSEVCSVPRYWGLYIDAHR